MNTTQPGAASCRTPPCNCDSNRPMTALKPGDTTTIGLAISNVNDLFSVPLLMHFDPAVVQVEEVRDGGFLAGRPARRRSRSCNGSMRSEAKWWSPRRGSRNSSGVNGSGTLLGFVVRAVAPGNSALQILQVNAHNSQQQPIPIVSGAATIQVH